MGSGPQNFKVNDADTPDSDLYYTTPGGCKQCWPFVLDSEQTAKAPVRAAVSTSRQPAAIDAVSTNMDGGSAAGDDDANRRVLGDQDRPPLDSSGEFENDVDDRSRIDGSAVAERRLEANLLCGLNRGVVQAVPQAPDDTDNPNVPAGAERD